MQHLQRSKSGLPQLRAAYVATVPLPQARQTELLALLFFDLDHAFDTAARPEPAVDRNPFATRFCNMHQFFYGHT